MKTIIHIDLDDAQRNRAAVELDGKPSKRLLSRGELNDFVAGAVAALSAAAVDVIDRGPSLVFLSRFSSEPDAEDAQLLQGKPPSYIRDPWLEPGEAPARPRGGRALTPNSTGSEACSHD